MKSDRDSHLDRLKPALRPAKAEQKWDWNREETIHTGLAISSHGPAKAAPWKWQKHQNKNDNNLSIQTPFSMILGSLESQKQAL
jgi:hypothetical protein